MTKETAADHKMKSGMKSVLIIGIQGALAKITAELLIKNNPQIIGDYKNDVIFLEELDFL